MCIDGCWWQAQMIEYQVCHVRNGMVKKSPLLILVLSVYSSLLVVVVVGVIFLGFFFNCLLLLAHVFHGLFFSRPSCGGDLFLLLCSCVWCFFAWRWLWGWERRNLKHPLVGEASSILEYSSRAASISVIASIFFKSGSVWMIECWLFYVFYFYPFS